MNFADKYLHKLIYHPRSNMAKIQGIYSILHINSGRIYVGSSKNIKKRMGTHKTDLRKNRHPNPALQNYYNKYGMDSFDFCIICEVEDANELINVENNHIARINNTDVGEKLDYEKLFNTQWANKTGCINPDNYKRGVEHHLFGKVGPNKDVIFSNERCLNMSKGQKGKISGTKGKTLIEMHGEEKAAELVKQNS